MDFLSTHSNSDVEDDDDDNADLFSPPSNSAKKQGLISSLNYNDWSFEKATPFVNQIQFLYVCKME